MFSCKPKQADKTAFIYLHFFPYSTTTTSLLYAKCIPCSLDHNSVSFSLCRLPALTSLCSPFTFTPQKTPENSLKVSKVHTTVTWSLCSCWIRQAGRQPSSSLTSHALSSRAELQEAGQLGVERTEAAVGSMSPLTGGNSNSEKGKRDISWWTGWNWIDLKAVGTTMLPSKYFFLFSFVFL